MLLRSAPWRLRVSLAAHQVDGTKSMDDVFTIVSDVLDKAIVKKDPMEAFCADAPAADECRVYE